MKSSRKKGKSSKKGKMPKGGYYFDSIIRQKPIDEARLNPADNLEEFGPISEEALRHYERLANDLTAPPLKELAGQRRWIIVAPSPIRSFHVSSETSK